MMNIELLQNKKLDLIQWLSTLENHVVIEKIMDLKRNEDKNWWDSISENEKLAIEQGLQDANMGKLNPQSSARKLYGKWL